VKLVWDLVYINGVTKGKYCNNNNNFYKQECLLDVHLSSIRPSTQHGFNNNNNNNNMTK